MVTCIMKAIISVGWVFILLMFMTAGMYIWAVLSDPCVLTETDMVRITELNSKEVIAKPIQTYYPTRGEVWPLPQYVTKFEKVYKFLPWKFQFQVTQYSCPILERAKTRLEEGLVKMYATPQRLSQHKENILDYSDTIHVLEIELSKPCEDVPYFEMDEKYNLSISASSKLSSDSLWGILRGIETVSQLFYLSENYTEVHIDATEIVDYPSYPHRGLMLDTGRNYISVDNILKTLDAMAINKMNVFHWHMVDDQSFPYESHTFPELSAKGAFFPTMVYTADQIKTILAYAHDRGIRVVPEFDIPGHTRSWGKSHPEILTECYDDEPGTVSRLGPVHPLRNATFNLIGGLFHELREVFPDSFLHIGGDEVDVACWLSNPEIRTFMSKANITNVTSIHKSFILEIMKLLDNRTAPMFWQEKILNYINLTNNSIVQVWRPEFITDMINALNSNHKVVLSAPWYLDRVQYTFIRLYNLPPREWVRTQVDEANLGLIVGGEACLWGEMVDDTNILSRTWPRASAVAELLWSSVAQSPLSGATLGRAQEHVCRMRGRGVPAAPAAGPAFCVI